MGNCEKRSPGNFGRQIAIIIPVYNAGIKIKKCICSILNQSFDSFSLILVDDGSTDESGKICDRYARKDSRICLIRQKNKGSIEARKAGIFSEVAQRAKYLMFCDADDVMPKDALKILLKRAEEFSADCVCGNIRRIIGNVLIPRCFISFIPPCFKNEKVKVYSHEAIMRELYVSCFGISNYPVTLSAKLYERELVTNAAKTESTIRFMGEDLSITLQIMPNIKRLVIISDEIYYYRVGGGTSKFMPYMLDDFLKLYCLKNGLIQKYQMGSYVKTLIDIELMNIVNTYLQICKYPGKYSDQKMRSEIYKVMTIPEIEIVASSLTEKGKSNIIAQSIVKKDIEFIANSVDDWYKQSRVKRMIKAMLGVYK